MGGDTLNIMSFNSSRKGFYDLPRGRKSRYLETVLNSIEPDICLMPGDDTMVSTNVVQGYGQYSVPSHSEAGGPVLLYDIKKMSMTSANVNFNGFGPMPGLDFDKMVCPMVTVTASDPVPRVVKEFSMVSWKYTLFHETNVPVETLTESIIRFTQRLAMQTGKPTLIGGEITLDYNKLSQIVRKLGHDSQEMFLNEIQPEMTEHKYLPSMTKASFRDVRHLFMMNVFKCDTSIIARADCFIASKALELKEAELMDVDEVLCRRIKMDPTKTCTEKPTATTNGHTTTAGGHTYNYCRPTKTEMVIPPRPPRHHGG